MTMRMMILKRERRTRRVLSRTAWRSPGRGRVSYAPDPLRTFDLRSGAAPVGSASGLPTHSDADRTLVVTGSQADLIPAASKKTGNRRSAGGGCER
jgi:hypothetical protein